MDIEKLDINAVCFGILCNFTPVCGEERAKEAVELVRTLQAENEKLRAELERVKRERDTAVSDLTFVVNQYRLETTVTDLCGLCEYDLPPAGENGQTAECPGFYVNDCFKWRGPEEG